MGGGTCRGYGRSTGRKGESVGKNRGIGGLYFKWIIFVKALSLVASNLFLESLFFIFDTVIILSTLPIGGGVL